MDQLAEFKQLYHLADNLIDELSKDQLAEVARLLALHLAHYAQRHGDIPHQNLLELLGVVELTEQQTKLLRNGMEFLVGYLGVVRDMEEVMATRQLTSLYPALLQWALSVIPLAATLTVHGCRRPTT